MRYLKLMSLVMVALVVSLPVVFAAQLDLVYDANGNLVSGDGKFREYNSLNQLSKVYNGSDDTGLLLEELTYHPVEERVLLKKVYDASGWKESVFYVSENFVRVVNSSGSFDFTYVMHEGQLVAQLNPDDSKIFIHGDHLGSTSVVTNGSGTVLENTTYSPFGTIIDGGEKSRYDYTGKEYDSVVGDYDFNARMYDSEQGQFIQPDSVIADLYEPQNLNRISYVLNNPYKYTDPDGLWAVQIGASGSGGVVPFFIGVGGGIAFSYGETEGFELGVYGSSSKGFGGVAGLKGTIDVSYSSKANRVSDLDGTSDTYGGSIAVFYGGGYDFSRSQDDDEFTSHTIHGGTGFALEGHYLGTDTITYTIYSSNKYSNSQSSTNYDNSASYVSSNKKPSSSSSSSSKSRYVLVKKIGQGGIYRRVSS